MSCCLCLKESDLFYNIYDEMDRDNYKFTHSDIILNYFTLKHIRLDSSICEKCSNIVIPFHIFCLQIQDTHKKVIELKRKSKTNQKYIDDNNHNLGYQSKAQSKNINQDENLNKISITNIPPKEEIYTDDKEEVGQYIIIAQSNNLENNGINSHKQTSINKLSILKEDYDENKSPIKNVFDIDNHQVKKKIRRSRKNLKTEKDKKRNRRTDNCINNKISKFMELECDLCNEKIITFKNLQKHFDLKHKRSGYVICCGMKFYKRYLLARHIDFHLGQTYTRKNGSNKTKLQCDKCEKTFSRIWTLKQHKAYHTPKRSWKYKCVDCKKTLPTHCHLNSHAYFAHKDRIVECHVCFESLKAALLNKHLKNHPKHEKESNQQIEFNSDSNDSENEMENISQSESETEESCLEILDIKHFACSICNELYSSEQKLNIHIVNEHT